MANPFGRYLRKQRERRRVSLRAFAVSIEMDPSNYSKIERGVLAPPKGEALERIGKALGIERFSSEWQRFHDLASVSRGELPADIAQNEEWAAAMPAFFQRLREERAAAPHTASCPAGGLVSCDSGLQSPSLCLAVARRIERAVNPYLAGE